MQDMSSKVVKKSYSLDGIKALFYVVIKILEVESLPRRLNITFGQFSMEDGVA